MTILGLLMSATAAFADRSELDLQDHHVNPASPCELLVTENFNFAVAKIPDHEVHLISGDNQIDTRIVERLRGELTEEKLGPFSEKAREVGFVDFYFDGFAGENAERKLANGSRLPLKQYIPLDLYLELEAYVVPRYRAGYSIVPHREIDKKRALVVRLYFAESSVQGRWHRDGIFSSSFKNGVRSPEKITRRGWTFAHSFDQADTEFKEIPNFSTSFDTSVIFDGATEEHRAHNQKGRIVILGTYYAG